tara:strand:+ start:453 stop:1043 length:591 start_codon:yes stop_codon:yes gene_type:complete
LAVSKKKSADQILEAVSSGISHFGENYVQEAVEKIQILKAYKLTWHYIGPIQSNKAARIAQNFDWVQSLDREKIAVKLNENRKSKDGALNTCIQVNLSGEMTKSGVAIDQAEDLCKIVEKLPNLHLRGLMAIPAPEQNFQLQRVKFRELSHIFHDLKKIYPKMDVLSMGMSNDYEAAIAEGSTMVRLGTALFGARL